MSSAGAGRVTVRYWAAARAAAGREADEVAADTLDQALGAVVEMHRDNPRFADVVGVCSVLVGSSPVSSQDPATVRLEPGDVVELLPPFAGG